MMARSLIAAVCATMAAAPLPLWATTLDEAIAAAIAHEPGLKAISADEDAAEARLDLAKAQRMPSATLSGTYGFGHLDPKNYFGLGPADVRPRAVQITVDQPLVTFGKIGSGIGQARAGLDASKAGTRLARSQLIAATAQAYGDVLSASMILQMSQKLLRATTEIERHAQLRFQVGESPSTDVSQSSARKAEAQAQLARAEGMLATARARFANITGLPADDLQPLPASPAVPETLEAMLDAAERASPQIAQAAAGLKAAKAARVGARAEGLPSISAFAEGGMVRDQFFPGYAANSKTIGLRARWTFFGGGRTAAKIDEAASAERAAQARLDAARAAVREQVTSAAQNVLTTRLVEQASRDQSVAADAALASIRQEVRVGLKPQIDLLDAEREAMSAAAAAAAARTDRIVAAYQLLSLIGQD